MRICFIGPAMSDCGGVQRVMATIANGLDKSHEVVIISLNNRGTDSFYRLNDKIKVINYNEYGNDKRVIARLIRGVARKTGCALKAEVAQYAYYPEKAVDKLCELIRSGGYDCVIASTIQCTILAGLIAEQLKNVKLLGWHHNSYRIYIEDPVHGFYIQSKLAARSLKRLNRLITLTEHDAMEYQKKMGIHCKYIYNPLGFSSEKKSDVSQKTLLYVGRLERKQKGIDMLISMAEELICKRGFTDWKLKIIGSGSGYEETRQQIEQCNLQKVVELLGEQKDVIKYYTTSAVFLSTSRWEGFGLVIIEAMECGLPVVSFRTDGPSEIISDGENGYLIDNYNMEQYMEKLELLMRDEDLRRKMSEQAIRRAKDFHIENIIAQWEKVCMEEL